MQCLMLQFLPFDAYFALSLIDKYALKEKYAIRLSYSQRMAYMFYDAYFQLRLKEKFAWHTCSMMRTFG